MEIERKFLIGTFPELPVTGENLLLQYFLSVTPYVRVRSKQKGDKITYKLCIKGEGDLSREEIEFSLTEDEFLRLKKISGHEAVTKLQKIYRLESGDKLECNLVDEGTENEFMYAEVEFENESDAEKFIPPDFLLREVTYSPLFKMNKYWEKTRLKGEKINFSAE